VTPGIQIQVQSSNYPLNTVRSFNHFSAYVAGRGGHPQRRSVRGFSLARPPPPSRTVLAIDRSASWRRRCRPTTTVVTFAGGFSSRTAPPRAAGCRIRDTRFEDVSTVAQCRHKTAFDQTTGIVDSGKK
jgi:hypothetical protein